MQNGSGIAWRCDEGLHPVAWGVWLVCALTAIFLTSNPLYLATLALAGLLVYATTRRPDRRPLDYLLAAGLLLATLSVPLNLLTGSTGPTDLVDLPSATLPGWLGHLRLGGPVTAESLVTAAGQATGIGAVLIVACAFNGAVDHFRLLKSVPAALAQLGVVASVGLLLMPETLARASALREARVVRGRSGRGVSDAVALALPLLSHALERSLQRAESLDARGFGRRAAAPRALPAAAGVAGLALAAAGAFAWYYVGPPAPAAAMATGAALVIMAFRSSGGAKTTQLYTSKLSGTDWLVMAAAVAGAGVLALERATGAGQLTYLAFPSISMPGYDLLPALACLLLLAPTLLDGSRSER